MSVVIPDRETDSSREANPDREALRRGWCPATLRPMRTGDGLLVRLHPPGATMTPAQLRQIASLAARHGNGLVEISARANLQIRGVSEASHPRLVAELLEQGLVDERDDGGPARITLTAPLAGTAQDGPLNAAALAQEIESAARGIAGLPAKTLVTVEGGTVALTAFGPDLRLTGGDGGTVRLGLPGGRWFGPLSPTGAVAAVTGLLAALARQHAAAPKTVRRLADLPEETPALPACAAPTEPPPGRRVGAFDDAAIVGLPFGRCDAQTLERFAEAAGAACAACATLRLSPWRGIACLGLSGTEAARLLALARGLGLVVAEGDARLALQACAGSPACARGQTPTLADAARLAQALEGIGREASLHLSGCVKGCAHPGPAAVTLTGRDGRYDLAFDGTTRAATIATLDLAEILSRLRPGGDIRRHLERNPAKAR